ncbi:MAG: hypothetical protein K8T25_19210 [Planctomycetia bacterium]|nr:hypothetical protein [Planctomycetia bacterium]
MPDETAGRVGKCPGCRAAVRVPGGADGADAKAAMPSPQSQESQPQESHPHAPDEVIATVVTEPVPAPQNRSRLAGALDDFDAPPSNPDYAKQASRDEFGLQPLAPIVKPKEPPQSIRIPIYLQYRNKFRGYIPVRLWWLFAVLALFPLSLGAFVLFAKPNRDARTLITYSHGAQVITNGEDDPPIRWILGIGEIVVGSVFAYIAYDNFMDRKK